MPPGPVKYTEAREQKVQRTVTLPGTVESRLKSTVASEVAGLVVELLVREGDRVTSGQTIAKLRTSTLDLNRQSVAGQLKEAKALLDQAARQAERARELHQSGVMSQSQFDEAESARTAAEGRVENLTAALAAIELDLAHMTIRAPFKGAVVARWTEVGQWIEVGGPVLDMAALGDIEVRVDVPERWFEGLRKGTPATVVFGAVSGATYEGTVSAVVPKAEPQARTFPVKVKIPNPEDRLGVGMLAQVTLATGGSERVTLVPKDAVVGAGKGQHIYRINGDSKVEMVEVTTGAGHGDWVVVQGDVKSGQKVVTRGNERLMPGMAVAGEPLEYAAPHATAGS
jgi:RND family efflux transporter MFP subunit